jgi:cytochrome c5
MRTLLLTLLLILVLGLSLKALAKQQPGKQNAKSSTTATAANKNGATDPGEQRFKENCGRCHIAPESLSPREVKAVVQHMRARAMLTAEDEKLILKYLAP